MSLKEWYVNEPGNTAWYRMAFTAGALVSNASVLSKFTYHVFNGDVINDESLTKMTRFSGDKGLGLFKIKVNNSIYWNHEYERNLYSSDIVIKSLMEYHWTGNVRELENIIEQAIVLCIGKRLIYGDWIPENKVGSGAKIPILEGNERNHILKAMEATNWRISGEKGAAKLLGMKRTTLESRMKKLGINRPN